MERISEKFEPAELLEFFEEISAIPRASFEEDRIADYLVSFAKSRGLDYFKDNENNVLIRKKASPSFEEEPPILLQGHTDMVCEKNSGTVHDFSKEPINIYEKKGFLRAEGTTLGADDGVAVAAMLAILDSGSIEHPELECLFTSKEEVGLLGAAAFDYKRIKSRRMINLDSENENEIVAGCAGGMRTDIELPAGWERARGKCAEITVSGLVGGHSGENINCGRSNAIRLLGRILLAVSRNFDMRVARMSGGKLDNAIPREAQARICLPGAGEDTFCALEMLALREADAIKGELSEEDSNFAFYIREVDTPELMAGETESKNLLSAVVCPADGVIKMSPYIAGIPEFSRNLGIAETSPKGFCVTFLTRSSHEAQIDHSAAELELLASLCGGSAYHHGRYPGWAYARESALRDSYISSCKELYSYSPEIKAIHAGLECGIIKAACPDMDIISVGPDMKNIHSPDEALSLASLDRFWHILLKTIASKA